MKKEFTILNGKNEKLFVETYTPNIIRSTIIFCHGITGCRKGRTIEDNYFQKLAIQLMEKNYKVVLFDMSGHGDSDGVDYEVTLSKSASELAKVIEHEVPDKKNISFLAFSYGAAVLSYYLSNDEVVPKKIVLYSPCLYPLEGCFLNKDSIFGKDIVKAYENGELKEKGFAIVGAKNFRFGVEMINECQNFVPESFEKFSDKILCLSSSQDVILDTKYNDDFCKKNNIKNIYLDASHSLFEEISKAFEYTISFVDEG